jgi:phosphatidylinositol alpha-1,6-mannosyltransferase
MRPHLLLTYDFPPMGGGVSRWMSELTRRYPPGGLVVSTGFMKGDDEVDETFPNRVERAFVPSHRLRTLPGLLVWSRHASVLARSTDVEFTWCGTLKPCGYAAKWVRERVGVPYGVLAHGHDFLALRHQLHRSRLKRRVAHDLLGAASVVVANSRWTAQLVRSVYEELELPCGEGRVRVVPLGTDPDFFRPGVDPTAVREKFGLEKGRWLLTVSRVVRHKGLDTVIRSLKLLDKDLGDVRYAIVGSGGALAEMKALAKELGVASRVKFLTNVTDADLPGLYNSASVYVGMSRELGHDVEGFGISLAEASASGLPVVAGRSGGIPDIVADGETGLLIDTDQPAAVAEAVGRVLGDDSLARRLGTEGRKRVESYFNWDRVARDLRTIGHEYAGASVHAG